MLEFEWIVSLAAIIVVDILLAGDNAVVIAMAARRLPPEHRKRAIWGGTALAILVRVSLVFFVTFLLRLPGLQIVGGSLLLIVAWRMTHPEEARAPGDDKSAANLREAIMAIVVADTVMGLDNILAVAGAARGDFTLVIVGFLLSIPIMVAGSFLILRMLEKRPWLALAGGALLFAIAARMFLDDPLVADRLAWSEFWEWGLVAAAFPLSWVLLAYFGPYSRARTAAKPR